MAVGVLAWKDGGRLARARARQHGVGPLTVVPGSGQWFDGQHEGGDVMASATNAGCPYSISCRTISLFYQHQWTTHAPCETIASQSGLFDHLINVWKFKPGPVLQPMTFTS
ncbi:uncharacterized protein [Triticum aestivum]|uniref:uncharacterized protein isoform X1 n=1 Tax=Triticum aestivum TaxID=4565 RepID=UPI001D003E91|nr:uncharacterized protein LOC123044499 isoform X1 [Triticum aestivum]